MNSLTLFVGAVVCAKGLRLTLNPKGRDQVEFERKARIDDIAAGATERFFEERRSLEAYPTPTWGLKSQRIVRIFGVFQLAAGLFLIGLGWFGQA